MLLVKFLLEGLSEFLPYVDHSSSNPMVVTVFFSWVAFWRLPDASPFTFIRKRPKIDHWLQLLVSRNIKVLDYG